MTDFFKLKIEADSKEKVLKFHIIIKAFDKGYNLSSAEVNSLYELYITGYSDKFYNNCVDKGYFKSIQTVRNSISKMTKLGIIENKNKTKLISTEFIPVCDNNNVIFNYMIGNR